jgi:hypothetical protein
MNKPGDTGYVHRIAYDGGSVPAACGFVRARVCASIGHTGQGSCGCLCTSLNPFSATEPGRCVRWAKFAAPSESVDYVTLLMPDEEPLDGIPVAR